MHNASNGRYDRMLSAVAATFLMVSSTAALAQSPSAPPPAKSAAELAIDAAVPMPEPANVPPPTAADIKPDTTAAAPAAIEKKDATASIPDKAPETAAQPAATAEPAKEAVTKDAAPTPAPVQAASAVPAADQPVADKLRDLIGSKGAKIFDRKAERVAVEAFYKGREYAPVLTEGGAVNARAKATIARLQDAASDGLNPADYPTPDFAAATTPDAQAEAELKLMASVLDYARQAQSGRMHWSQVSGDILYPEHPIDPGEVIAKLASTKDVAAALDSYNPKHKGYLALKAKLAELRGKTETQAAPIPDGETLKFTPARKKQAAVEMEDPRVPQLRARLGLTENTDDTRYDEKVATAVRKFQANSDLKTTGVLDAQTVRALNSPKKDRQIDIVRVNMERWRWLPRDLGAPAIGDAYVILNIPDYTLKVMQHGQQVWTTRVVTGKPGNHATPLLTETMKYITVNPTWNVPPSIIYNEYLPALQQDPGALERIGLKLERSRDGSIRVWQPPGERNALGRIRFNFPNKFLVYQHDTPDKNLFARDERAFSHGCMRVQNPDQYAATLLNITMPNERYTPERIRGMYGSGEIDLKFPTPIPVNITYQTAFVDDAGKLEFRKDVYGRDNQMLAILRNSQSKDLEAVVAHAQPSYARPKGDIPQGVAMNNDNGGSGFNFFERLFGGPQPAPAPARSQQQRRVFTR
ncbi:L,D-transpeptidase family protein [Bradyrhizobium prioriisuperbiae]|uniref:L,D-transpeptidase family protein n=1 Tax=Bradyrhizobium prioriisuperbiae TaxID=2854389 RepID=UPI0028E9C9E1|nr:L,D-transpeptidase family protein [Bradyrhizobium prioritasuperba]